VKAPFEAVASAINSHPRTVLIALAAAILFALVGTSLVSMATGTDTYLDKDTPRGMLLAKYSETFQSDAMLVLIEADDVLNHPSSPTSTGSSPRSGPKRTSPQQPRSLTWYGR